MCERTRRRWLRDGLSVLALGATVTALVATSGPWWEEQLVGPSSELTLEAPWDLQVVGYRALIHAPAEAADRPRLEVELRGAWDHGAASMPEDTPEVGLHLAVPDLPDTFTVGRFGPPGEPFVSVTQTPCEAGYPCEVDALVAVRRAGPYTGGPGAEAPVVATVAPRVRLSGPGDEAPELALAIDRQESWQQHWSMSAQTVLSAGVPRERPFSVTASSPVEVQLGLGVGVVSRWTSEGPDGPAPQVDVVLARSDGTLLGAQTLTHHAERAGGHVFVHLRPEALCGDGTCAEPEPLVVHFVPMSEFEGELVLDWTVRVDAFGLGAPPADLEFFLEP